MPLPIPNFALYSTIRTEIPVLMGRVDGYFAEEHRLELGTTEHPIESGSTLTDNAVRRRTRLRLEGMTSDVLPIDDSILAEAAEIATLLPGRIAALSAQALSAIRTAPTHLSGAPTQSIRSADTWAAITDLFEQRTPVMVVTPIRTYTDMLIARAIVPRDRTTGKSLRFTLDLIEVLFSRDGAAAVLAEIVDEFGPAAFRTSAVDAGDKVSRAVSFP